jgi:hypothetical protein
VGRTASRGADGLVTALTGLMSDLPVAVWICAAATDQERQVPTVRLRLVEVDRQAPRRLVHGDRQPAAVDLLERRIQLDFIVGAVPGLLCQGPSRAAGTRAPRGDRTESPPRSTSWTCVGCCVCRCSRTDGRSEYWMSPCHQPRPGREELMALGAFATPTAELVRTGVELISRNREMAQLRQALTSRIWIEQAKGVLAASQGSPWMRRSSNSGVRGAVVVVQAGRPGSGEVLVQEAQRERVVALAMDDARVRAAEARAQAAGQALQAGPNRAGPTYRGPGPSPRRPGRTGAGRRPTRASRRPERLAGGWPW